MGAKNMGDPSDASLDAIVIGSGPLGAAAARRLVEHRQRVAIVERGPAISAPAGSHVRNAERFQRDPESFLPAIAPYLDYCDAGAPPPGLPGACISTGIGGQGVLWTNNTPRADAIAGRPDTMSGGAWEHYFGEAERYLGASGNQFGASFRQRRVIEHLLPPMAKAGRTITHQSLAGRVIDAARIHYNATADILADVADDVTIHRGNARLRTQGNHCAVEIGGVVIAAKTVIVAAGAIDTPRMLWEAGIRPAALGRHLTYHPVIAAQIVLGDGLWSTAPAADPPPRLQIPPSIGHPWNTMVLRDINPFAPAADDRDAPRNRLIELQLFCPVDPHPDNCMTFTAEGVVFHVPLRAADEDRRSRMMKDAHALGALLGRFRRGCEPQWMALGFAHIMGSCRISAADDGTGIADADGRVWGFENLYLATVGLIPSRLAVNPTLTGVAMAIRTADRIAGTEGATRADGRPTLDGWSRSMA